MIVAACGGRIYDRYDIVFGAISNLRPRPTLILHGGASGADTLTQRAADELGIPAENHWTNQKAQLLVAFPGGKGTEGVIQKAKKAKVKILYILYP